MRLHKECQDFAVKCAKRLNGVAYRCKSNFPFVRMAYCLYGDGLIAFVYDNKHLYNSSILNFFLYLRHKIFGVKSMSVALGSVADYQFLLSLKREVI